MQRASMTSIERVVAALQHQEPDRVPVLLLLTMHGARELGMTIRDYFASPAAVAEGQLRMQRRYGHDCLYAFQYAAVEAEAFGSETIFHDDGPPNAGAPVVRRPDDILRLTPPSIEDVPGLRRVLDVIARLKAQSQDVPIIGVVMSPFSLPVMQLGFETYLDVLHERPDLTAHLMRVNEAFCVAWGNAQLAAGATALCYFDPCVSPTVTAQDLSAVGFAVARRTIAQLRGPVVTHLASGRCLSVADSLCATGTAGIGVGCVEDLGELKAAFRGRLGVIGNLNGIVLCRTEPAQAERLVRSAIEHGAPGGGFILSDSHGELPWQVSEEVISTIAETARRFGAYPIAHASVGTS